MSDVQTLWVPAMAVQIAPNVQASPSWLRVRVPATGVPERNMRVQGRLLCLCDKGRPLLGCAVLPCRLRLWQQRCGYQHSGRWRHSGSPGLIYLLPCTTLQPERQAPLWDCFVEEHMLGRDRREQNRPSCISHCGVSGQYCVHSKLLVRGKKSESLCIQAVSRWLTLTAWSLWSMVFGWRRLLLWRGR